MATCGSLQHIFETPMPENPSLLDSLSPWNQIKKSTKPIDDHSSFTELFGELHFKENPESVPSVINRENDKYANYSAKSPISDYFSTNNSKKPHYHHRNSDSFSSMNSESLQLCTEGLGFESFDDVEDLKMEFDEDWKFSNPEEKIREFRPIREEGFSGEGKRTKSSDFQFPPPISCIGTSGRPWVCFKSYRHDGRFVLKEIRIPTQEYLHAKREDGRLKLQFFRSEDETIEEDEEGEEEDESDDYCEENYDLINENDEEKVELVKINEVEYDT